MLKYVRNHPLLDLDRFGYIVVHPGFCEEVVDTADRFFDKFPAALIVEAWRFGA